MWKDGCCLLLEIEVDEQWRWETLPSPALLRRASAGAEALTSLPHVVWVDFRQSRETLLCSAPTLVRQATVGAWDNFPYHPYVGDAGFCQREHLPLSCGEGTGILTISFRKLG